MLWGNSRLNKRGRLVIDTTSYFTASMLFICGFLSGLKFFDFCLPRSYLLLGHLVHLDTGPDFAPLSVPSFSHAGSPPGLVRAPALLSLVYHSLIS